MMSDDTEHLFIHYEFRFPDGSHLVYPLILDGESALKSPDTSSRPPDWARLSFHQCSNCPLSESQVTHCPVAAALGLLVDDWTSVLSYDSVHVTATLPDKRVSAEANAQSALSSLVGLLMATSDCPHMAFFRPMARFHVPMASLEETMFRAVGTYLIASYLRAGDRALEQSGLDGLEEIYRHVQVINAHMARRLREATQQDAAVNALVILDVFAKAVPLALEDALDELRVIFAPLLGGGR